MQTIEHNHAAGEPCNALACPVAWHTSHANAAPIREAWPMTAADKFREKVERLREELPGISFGYIGNVGVDRSGRYDDRSWRVFLPHPGRVGESFRDDVHVGRTEQLEDALEFWPAIELQVRTLYAKERRS